MAGKPRREQGQTVVRGSRNAVTSGWPQLHGLAAGASRQLDAQIDGGCRESGTEPGL